MGASEHSRAVAALEGALANHADRQAALLDDYFQRARSINLLLAHNPAFARFYATRAGWPTSSAAAGRP